MIFGSSTNFAASIKRSQPWYPDHQVSLKHICKALFAPRYFSFSLCSSKQTHKAAMRVRSTLGATVTKYCIVASDSENRMVDPPYHGMGFAHSIFIGKDFPNIEEAARDMSHRLASESDACWSIEPATPDIKLDSVTVGCVLEGHSRLWGEYFGKMSKIASRSVCTRGKTKSIWW